MSQGALRTSAAVLRLFPAVCLRITWSQRDLLEHLVVQCFSCTMGTSATRFSYPISRQALEEVSIFCSELSPEVLTCSRIGAGGAVYVQFGVGNVTNCQFVNNSASSSAGDAFGGAVFLQSGSSIYRSVFTANSASGIGGMVIVTRRVNYGSNQSVLLQLLAALRMLHWRLAS